MKSIRICISVLQAILLGLLLSWVLCAPLVWMLRDGLGPGAVETTGFASIFKSLGMWSVPALILVVPLVGLWFLGRWLASEDDRRSE